MATVTDKPVKETGAWTEWRAINGNRYGNYKTRWVYPDGTKSEWRAEQWNAQYLGGGQPEWEDEEE